VHGFFKRASAVFESDPDMRVAESFVLVIDARDYGPVFPSLDIVPKQRVIAKAQRPTVADVRQLEQLHRSEQATLKASDPKNLGGDPEGAGWRFGHGELSCMG